MLPYPVCGLQCSLRTLTGHCVPVPQHPFHCHNGGLTLGTTSQGHLCGKQWDEGGPSRKLAFCGSCFRLLLPFRLSYTREGLLSSSPTLPQFPGSEGLEERRSGDPPTCRSAVQWLPWAWPRGWERPRLLSPQYGPNYSSAPSLPVIVVSGSQRMLEICWSSRDLGFPPGMGLDFPLGTGCPAPIFSWGAG